ncbi:high-affinity nickel-transport protein [Trinickia symbiotica]|uniref:Nickel/cobalt efflux system n=1 Tax=Trinickia symbiotica TaxID=863227 RepID=A0A2N7XA06_9BURK|nr:HoxN/HupN/NixA family nickel/cobalt transporter [Trinickia symbiotica]PMS38372.1 HoxN/HupN/NixA family nickel/cobalt transporter [Trinickia symbiotica]PPK42033.1 high-affinity nickel-transport protein [Trinickia symbiotica]
MSIALKTPCPPLALRRRVVGIYSVLAAFNIGAWIWAFIAFRAHPLLLGTGLLAYGFGLRHAVDADHIAAIDNVTRKLMQDGQRPVTVGFFFALGHSAVVLIVAAAVAATAAALESRVEAWKEIGGIISTSVSSLFLFLIAAINIVILRGVWHAFGKLRRGEPYDHNDLDLLLNSRGLLSRLFRPLFRIVSKPLWMLPLGFLFGLGFDTATEVSLLGISASQAAQGVSMSVILVFPVLFAAGMSLVDTTDGILMLGAYDWAFIRPIRKLYYNLTITLVSVVVAVLIGGIEALGLLADQFRLKGGFWSAIGTLNDNFNSLGFIIIGVFIFAWVASFLIYRVKGYDDLPAYQSGQ